MDSSYQCLKFEPAWWLRNPHAQTVWPTLQRRPIEINEYWERLRLPDDDFIDLVWDANNREDANRPIVIILHGLTGNIESSYARGLMKALTASGFRPLFMHFRGCSGQPNHLIKSYHCGDTRDLAYLVADLRKRYPSAPLSAVGVSLGANILLKWLGETGSRDIEAAVAVSTPFDLHVVGDCLARGSSRFYQRMLISSLKQTLKEKYQKEKEIPFDLKAVDKIATFWDFDEVVTVPLHGFKSVKDYYTKSSCKNFLEGIAVPTLLIHAKDDPFMIPTIIPDRGQLSATTELLVSENGGHVGFVMGNVPRKEKYWLELSIPHFLSGNSSVIKDDHSLFLQS